jgi:hypothetical protein
MNSIGPGKLKSNPNSVKISDSKLINYYFETYYYSPSGSIFIIRLKLGDNGSSSLAAIRRETTERCSV